MLGKAVFMSLETTEISVFVSVVKLGSFARAAQEHGMTPSGVSRVVSRLEERLAVRLLQRSTRRLSLTESGAVLFRRGQRVLHRRTGGFPSGGPPAVRQPTVAGGQPGLYSPPWRAP